MPDFSPYQPLDEYKNRYQELHRFNTSDFFENCVKVAGIDEQENIKIVEKIDQHKNSISKTGSSLKKKRLLKNVVTVVMVTAIAVCVLFTAAAFSNPMPKVFIIILCSVGLAVYSFLLDKNKITPSIKNLDQETKQLQGESAVMIEKAWQQLKPLISQLDSSVSARLFEKTYPLIQLDDKFHIERFSYLNRKFGLRDNTNTNVSTYFVQSGEINGNPFCFFKTLNHYMSQKTYRGSLSISWTDQYMDHNGKWQTRYQSQTLTAKVTKPYPDYYRDTFLVYGNEAAPNLIFTRTKSKANELNEKQLEKYVKSKAKEIENLARKKISQGENFTAMGNLEFEALFGATDRNNEQEFRLLFTPLAQREILNLIKDKSVAWGDNFKFRKNQMLNAISADHLRDIDVSGSINNYVDYDLARMRSKFNKYNNLYFKSIYFAFAPLLAIPLYQDHKTHEFIYKDVYNQRFSNYEHERIVNNMDRDEFAPPNSVTRNILKTTFVQNDADTENINVIAYGFTSIDRTEYVQVHGGDGRWHDVPVHWTEYIPVSKATNINLERSWQTN